MWFQVCAIVPNPDRVNNFVELAMYLLACYDSLGGMSRFGLDHQI